MVDEQTSRERADATARGSPEEPLREKGAKPLARQQLMQPRVERAAGERPEDRDHELRDEQQRDRSRARTGDERNDREQQDQKARDAHRHDGDLASLPQTLDQRNRGKLDGLTDERNRRQHPDREGAGTECKREPNQDHAAVQRSGHAGPGRIAD